MDVRNPNNNAHARTCTYTHTSIHTGMTTAFPALIGPLFAGDPSNLGTMLVDSAGGFLAHTPVLALWQTKGALMVTAQMAMEANGTHVECRGGGLGRVLFAHTLEDTHIHSWMCGL